MKVVPTLLIIGLLAVGIFLVGKVLRTEPEIEYIITPKVPPQPSQIGERRSSSTEKKYIITSEVTPQPSPPPRPDPRPPSPDQWKTWVEEWKKNGYQVLTTKESQNYLNEHDIEISPKEVGFLGTKRVSFFIKISKYAPEEFVKKLKEVEFDIVTVDHYGNLRVAVTRFNGGAPFDQWKTWVEEWEKSGYKVLTVEKSQQWLKEHPGISTTNRGFVMTPAGDIITVDHNGKTRVAVKR